MPFGEKPGHTPNANPATKLVHTLESHVALSTWDSAARNIGQADLVALVAVISTVLRAFLIIEHKLQSETRPIWPFWIRPSFSISDEVSI